MSFRFRRIAMVAAVAATFVPAVAFATNGYFSHGFGIKAKGMGGAGIALPQDSIAAAINPAGMFYVGNRADFGIDWFKPTRGAEIVGSLAPTFNGSYDGSATKNFYIPELGYNRMLSPTMSAGVSVYGNGGMNTDYTTPFPVFGTSNAGVNLEQAFIAPTIAWQPVPGHAFGASLNIAYQRFKATGLENFTGTGGPPQQFSAYPGNVTNQGNDTSYGWGVRVGWIGKFAPACDFGATYQSKTYMEELDKYKGLFAEQGGFDIPANYGVGMACRLAPVTLAFDVVQIEYSGIRSINNPLLPNLFQSPLGTDNGAGFAWQDVTAFKFGAQWLVNPDVILRAGYNYGEQPIPQNETLFNVLAPGVVEDHYTLGGTFKVGTNGEVSFAYMYAPKVTVNGVNSIPPAFGGGNTNIYLKEQSLGVAFGWRY